jgi:aminotransferase
MRSPVSQRLRAIPDSGLLRFFDILATMDNVLSLGIGEPDLATPETICDAAIASIRRGETGYTANAGILELRQLIAADLQQRYGVSYDPETEILVTVGVSEALHAAILSLVAPGDDVLVPEPCFVSYVACVALANARAVDVATRADEGFELSVARLEQA